MRIGTWLLGGSMALTVACNSLDKLPSEEGVRVVIPVDSRPAVQALGVAPPISGGTLAVSPDGKFAIAADPDRDRISIVDLLTQEVRHIALQPGDEPGRVIADRSGRAYVALRRAGNVVSVLLGSAQIESSVHACAAARGLALEPGLGLLHLACADGRLVTLSAAHSDPAVDDDSTRDSASLAILRELTFDDDLRDVVVRDDRLMVSTFKSAGLIEVDPAGKAGSRTPIGDFQVQVSRQQQERSSFDNSITLTDTIAQQPMSARIAWRTALSPNGDVYVLHQGASQDVVDIDHQDAPSASSSTYGGGSGSGCGAIVGPALSVVDRAGNVQTIPLSSGVLSVDMAIAPRSNLGPASTPVVVGTAGGARIAIVQAGGADPNAPRPTTLFDNDITSVSAPSASVSVGSPVFPGGDSLKLPSFDALPRELSLEQAGTSIVSVFETDASEKLPFQGGPVCAFGAGVQVIGQATAVAFSVNGDLLVQSREPAALTIIPTQSSPADPRTLALGGESARDTGHEIFHRDAGGGIACASCHAEGAEDGHTWNFSTIGSRRTQALYVGLEGTEPFHWNGDESDLGAIMADVFVGRMGGVHQSAPRMQGLKHWLFALTPPAPIVAADSEAAVRGKALFESAATGCTACHTGSKLTNNKTVDVGTGGKLQVPSLRGVGYRLPLMHSGCATRLEDRFDPACGGSRHGGTAQLNTAQIGDMVAFLRTL